MVFVVQSSSGGMCLLHLIYLVFIFMYLMLVDMLNLLRCLNTIAHSLAKRAREDRSPVFWPGEVAPNFLCEPALT